MVPHPAVQHIYIYIYIYCVFGIGWLGGWEEVWDWEAFILLCFVVYGFMGWVA